METNELKDRNKELFLEICRNEIYRDGIEDLIGWLLNSDFFDAPASSKYHGAYAGGLVEHSLNVYECLKRICLNHPEFDINTETIAICALFHDLCKANFYKIGTRNVKDENTGQWYKKEVYEIDERFPIGHGEKSCIIIQWFLKKLTVDELLAIRYHMGGFDPIVKGGDFGMSKAYEMCPLAAMLHLADMEATYLIESQTNT